MKWTGWPLIRQQRLAWKEVFPDNDDFSLSTMPIRL
jgi:hypothetical protein